MISSTLFMTKSTFSYQKAPKTKVALNYLKRMFVVQFTKTIAFWRLSWFQANFHDIKHPFHNKSTFSYQKAQKAKVAQNHTKQFLVEPILCFVYIFGELGVFLSKTVSQVQFTKTIVFWRLSWLQGNFHDIKHPFHDKKHFFIPKSTKNKSCQNYLKRMFVEPILCFAYYFGEFGSFPFQNS